MSTTSPALKERLRGLNWLGVVVWIAVVIAGWWWASADALPRQLLIITATAYLGLWGAAWIAPPRRGKAISPARRTRLILLRFLAVSCSLALGLILVELVAFVGLINFRPVFGKPLRPWENPLNLLDAELIHRHPPHLHQQGRLRGGDLVDWVAAEPTTIRDYDFQCDRDGFRNPADYDTAECIVIGDSFVEGGSVAADELLTHHLAQQLNSPVINLAQSGYGPQQELHVLRRYGLPKKPRVCVWVFFEGNDLSDVGHYQEFTRDWPRAVSRYALWKEGGFTRNALTRLSELRRVGASLGNGERWGWLATPKGERRLWFGYPGQPLSEPDEAALQVIASSLRSAAEMCLAEQIRFVVVFAPTKYRVYQGICRFGEDSPIREWVVNELPQRLARIVSELPGEVSFLDLTPGLRTAAQAGELVYYPDDTHWSPAGHAEAAKQLSAFLRREYPGELSTPGGGGAPR